MLQLLILYDFVPQSFTYQIIDKYIYVKSILSILVILEKCLLKFVCICLINSSVEICGKYPTVAKCI